VSDDVSTVVFELVLFRKAVQNTRRLMKSYSSLTVMLEFRSGKLFRKQAITSVNHFIIGNGMPKRLLSGDDNHVWDSCTPINCGEALAKKPTWTIYVVCDIEICA
jgi:hypothetical protein